MTPKTACVLKKCEEPRYTFKTKSGRIFHAKRCKKHHKKRLKQGGRNGGRRVKKKYDGVTKDGLQFYDLESGYRFVRVGDRHIAEHRYRMEQKLGRKLRRGESVHHKDGVRNNNRKRNLELWVGGIRYGQRALDLVCPHCNKPYGEK